MSNESELSFTIIKNSEITKKIMHDIRLIKKHISKEFQHNVIALFLTGGFGRGEGGIIKEGDQNLITIVNDYDLHLITKYPINKKRLKVFSENLSKKLNLPHIDIIAQPIYTLSFLKNTQYGYDLKHGSHLIYGNKKILSKIPESSKFSLTEIEKLLMTRIWCFLGPIKKDFFTKGIINQEERFFLFEQLSKALLAVEESWLIYNRDYHVSYIEKLNRIKRYIRNKDKLRWFEWATWFKLTPTYKINLDPIESYFKVKEIFLNDMFIIINKAYGKNFNSWIEYIQWSQKRPNIIFMNILRFLRDKNLSYKYLIKVKQSQLLLVDALNKTEIKPVNIEIAKEIINSIIQRKIIVKSNSYEDEWWRLKEIVIKLQELYL